MGLVVGQSLMVWWVGSWGQFKNVLSVTYRPYVLCGVPYGTKFWQGKILMNGHLEIFDEKNLTNFIMLTPTFINDWRDWRGKTYGPGAYNDNALC